MLAMIHLGRANGFCSFEHPCKYCHRHKEALAYSYCGNFTTVGGFISLVPTDPESLGGLFDRHRVADYLVHCGLPNWEFDALTARYAIQLQYPLPCFHVLDNSFY